MTVEDYFDCRSSPMSRGASSTSGSPGLTFQMRTSRRTPSGWARCSRTGRSRPQRSTRASWSNRDELSWCPQGTVDNHDPRKLMIPAIEAFAGSDRLLVVATGGVGTEELRSRYPYPNVLIEDFVDFD